MITMLLVPADAVRKAGRVLVEWLWRRDALVAARAIEPLGPGSRSALSTGRALSTFATELMGKDAGEDSPDGLPEPAAFLAAHAVLVEAAAWTLAVWTDGNVATTLAEAWDAAQADGRFAAIAPERVAAARSFLVDRRGPALVELSYSALEAELNEAIAFVQTLLDQAAVRANPSMPVVRQRIVRVFAATLALMALGVAFWFCVLFPDMAKAAHWRASSAVLPGIPTEGTGCTLQPQHDYFFHTAEEASPWIQFDLGRDRRVRSVSVENIKSCCQERAAPLVLSVSSNGTDWRDLGHQNEMFTTWSPSFAATKARYVRLAVQKKTWFHLAAVHIR